MSRKRRGQADRASGRFEFEGLPAGEYRLWVSTQREAGAVATVGVGDGERGDVGEVRVAGK